MSFSVGRLLWFQDAPGDVTGHLRYGRSVVLFGWEANGREERS